METVCEHCGRLTKIRKNPSTIKREKSKDAKEVIQFYIDSFKENNKGEEPVINWAGCVLATNKMLKHRTKDDLKVLIQEYLKSGTYPYKQSGYRYLLFPAWLQARVVNEVKEQVCNIKARSSNLPAWDGLL